MIREVRDLDREPVDALLRRHGMAPGTSSEDEWTALWRENPFLAEADIPDGWVLEDSQNVVGYLGNVALRYHFGGRRLVAAATRGFAVDVEHRRHSLRLAAAFFSQPRVDLLLNTTANAPAASVFQVCKAVKIPQPNYDKALFWIADEKGFARALLRRQGRGPAVAACGSVALSPGLKLEALLRRRGPVKPDARWQLDTIDPANLTSEFDDLWARTLKARSGCLLADRSLAALRWHFGHRGAGKRQAKFVCARENGMLVGYTVLTREGVAEIDLTRSRIADLMAERDDPGVIDALLYRAFQQARADGSHVLELIGFPSPIRDRCAAGNAHERQLPSWPFWYKAASAELSRGLRDERAWYGSSYDGDATV